MAPSLKKLLVPIFAAVAFLGASGAYLAALTALEHLRGETYQSHFSIWIFGLHLAVGALVTLPFLVFAALHTRSAYRRPNRRAVRAGLALLGASVVVIVSGLALAKRDLGEPWNSTAYWLHIASPIAALALYIAHRLAGPPIAWRRAGVWGGAVGVFVLLMILLHAQNPREWYQDGPEEGERYFFPSLTRTSNGNFIPAETLMMDEYCLSCHPDTYSDWFHSAHHFSSFNNPAYRFSVRETRQVALERDGDTRAARWCAGCHDPVPFLSGRFDDPNFDDVNDPTAHAGVTCTVCHAITNVGSTRGNADYTIEEPVHYPLAFSEDPLLQWINNQLVKAKPALHRKTFLKPFHKTAEFCSTCHKVHIPRELNHYKDFLRGQNHYDAYLLSGVSGHGARSFYYPETARPNCSEACHMPLKDSADFGNRDGKVHDHLFPGANTGLAELRGHEETRRAQEEFLANDLLRIDIFGLRREGTIEGELIAPLRPEIPELVPGSTYLVEVVLRTLAVGHLFTQGTADSNQVWVDVEIRDGERLIGRSGAIDERGFVDPWSRFINVLMLDRDGNRIDRRNPQDIFVPLYNRQIPPGAGQIVHYRLAVPDVATGPIEIRARLRYRKFDRTYMEHVFGAEHAPNLRPVDMCEDRVALPVAGGARAPEQRSKVVEWQRWNDYGIGLLLEGQLGAEKGELRQAEEAFRHVAELGRPDGHVNLARVFVKEGRLDDAVRELRAASEHPELAAPWTVLWLGGVVNRQNGELDAAIRDFEAVLSTRVPERGFDFSLDYAVRTQLALALFDRSKLARGERRRDERLALLRRSGDEFRRVLEQDSENLAAHHNLHLVESELHYLTKNAAHAERAARHLELARRYQPDNNASDTAKAIYRAKNPAANHAAQSIVIHDTAVKP